MRRPHGKLLSDFVVNGSVGTFVHFSFGSPSCGTNSEISVGGEDVVSASSSILRSVEAGEVDPFMLAELMPLSGCRLRAPAAGKVELNMHVVHPVPGWLRAPVVDEVEVDMHVVVSMPVLVAAVPCRE